MLNPCLEMKVLKYGFVSLLLLAATLFIIHPTQNEVFGQGANTTNTTNATETERPTADGLKAGFVPDSEDGAAPPPPPANAITVDKLPKENPVKDPDSDSLSITNRTEILQILPANSSKIIKHVDEDLKNTTGVGLAPKEVLDKLTSGSKDNKSNDNKSLLQLATPDEVKQIESIAVNTTGAGSEEDEPVTNATSEKAQAGGEANATATNATSGESPSQTKEQAKQTEGQKEQAKTGAEEQALAGTPEVTNMTNATSGEQPSQTGEEQKQTKGGDEQSLNTTNVTSMLNATDSKGGNDNPKDGNDNPEDGG